MARVTDGAPDGPRPDLGEVLASLRLAPRRGQGISEARRLDGAPRRAREVDRRARPVVRRRPGTQGDLGVRAGPRRRREPAQRSTPSSATPRRSTRWPSTRAATSSPRCTGELEDTAEAVAKALDELELRSLFSGEHDERDAVAEIHAGAGGTDAQDWAEMMLRMYLRWAERRGFAVEVDEVSEGGEAGILSATFIVRGRYAYGLLAAERGVHRLVRMSPVRLPAPASDELRLLGCGTVPRGSLRRGRHRREGPAHRHLPLLRCRRPARQRDRLGRTDNAPSHRDRHLLPERAQPAPEQGQGAADPRRQARRAAAGRAPKRSSRPFPARSATWPGEARSAPTSLLPTSS